MAQNFSILLVVLTLLTGIVWILHRKGIIKGTSHSPVSQDSSEPFEPRRKEVMIQEAADCFPWLAAILILRSFLFEPFQIPTGSMIPTLLVGDFIWVEKYAYGLRDPVTRSKFLDTGAPERGDIMVFKYPKDPEVDYIKRVIGLPGDVIRYTSDFHLSEQGHLIHDKKLRIKPACREDNQEQCGRFIEIKHRFANEPGLTDEYGRPMLRGTEDLLGVEHDIWISPSIVQNQKMQISAKHPTEFVVPEGQYFAMGDNRDNSLDSRYWGFVPEENLVGKAVAIWISFEFERRADSWLPGWIPTGIRFNRIGGLQ
jgi:signal peptidase I